MNAQKGFTLLESLVALVLLAIMLMGVTAHSMTMMGSLAQARHMAVAINLAQDRMETLMNSPYGSVNSGSDANNPLTEQGTAGGIYSVSWTVTNDSPAGDLKDVTVTTTWTDKVGTHSYGLRSVVGP
jgi:prepilin-type N-terminal cleavage/methylation domain-containing protein